MTFLILSSLSQLPYWPISLNCIKISTLQLTLPCYKATSYCTKWSSCLKHSFNTSKWKLLLVLPLIVPFLPTLSDIIKNHDIYNTPQHCDRGILLSNDILWEDKYTDIIFKAYKTYNFIRCSTSNSHSPHTKLSLHITLIYLKLLYCSHVWHPYWVKT